MKVHLSQRFFNVDGTPVVFEGSTDPRILKDVILEALLNPGKEEQSPKDKYDNYTLYGRLKEEWKYFDFTAEEIVKLKKLTGTNPYPLIMGQTWDMLEGGIVDPNPKPPPPPPPSHGG